MTNTYMSDEIEQSKSTVSSKPYSVDETIKAVDALRIRGNITGYLWYRHVCFNSGETDFLGIAILADIVSWYQPRIIRSEITGEVIGYEKKFYGDKLHRSIQSYADQFKIKYGRVSDALKRLVNQGLIEKELRTINTKEGRIGNVLYISPVVEAIAAISQMPKDLPEISAKSESITPEHATLSVSTQEGYSAASNEEIREHHSLCVQTHKGKSPSISNTVPLHDETHKVVCSSDEGHSLKHMTYTLNTKPITKITAAISNGSKVSHVANIAAAFSFNEKREATQEEFPNTTPKLSEPLSESVSLTPNDMFIGKELTERQQATIRQKVALLPQELVKGLSVHLAEDIEADCLNPRSFNQCGQDFQYKLNAIMGEIKKGKWLPVTAKKAVIESEVEATKAVDNALMELRQRNQKYWGDYHHYARFIAYAKTSGKRIDESMLLSQYEAWEGLREVRELMQAINPMMTLPDLPQEPYIEAIQKEGVV